MTTKDQAKASQLLADPAVMAAATAEKWADPLFPGHDVVGLVGEMHKVFSRVRAGNLADVEAILVCQAMALQVMFANLSRQAAQQKYLPNLQAFTGMALKTQAACRQTLEALSEMKNPRPVVYGQANIAQQQVVSNGIPKPLAHVEETSLENELLPQKAPEPVVSKPAHTKKLRARRSL
jgi:hypothetical protein